MELFINDKNPVAAWQYDNTKEVFYAGVPFLQIDMVFKLKKIF